MDYKEMLLNDALGVAIDNEKKLIVCHGVIAFLVAVIVIMAGVIHGQGID